MYVILHPINTIMQRKAVNHPFKYYFSVQSNGGIMLLFTSLCPYCVCEVLAQFFFLQYV